MEVSPAVLGVGLEKHERQTVDSPMRDVTTICEGRTAFFITGGCDLDVHVAVCDIKNLKKLALDRFTAGPEGTHIGTLIIFDAIQRNDLTDQDR